MATLDGTLRPIELVYDSQVFFDALNRSLPGPDEHLIGFCFRRFTVDGFPSLVAEPVVLNPGRDSTRRLQILSDLPDLLVFRGMNIRDSFYNWANPLDRAVLFSHIDFSQISNDVSIDGNRAGTLQRIRDFDLVFVNADILRYFHSLNTGNLYVSLAVADFFTSDDQMGSYQTLKFSPYSTHVAPTNENFAIPTAYYLAPSCPPMWREQLVHSERIDNGFTARALDTKSHIFITMGEIIDAYKEIGIKIGKESTKTYLKAGGSEGLTKSSISKMKDVLFSK